VPAPPAFFSANRGRSTSILPATWPKPKCHSARIFKFSNFLAQITAQWIGNNGGKLHAKCRQRDSVDGINLDPFLPWIEFAEAIAATTRYKLRRKPQPAAITKGPAPWPW
jgi:hypothetical protein